MPDWDYGGAFQRHPCASGIIRFNDGSCLKVHDIFDSLPKFMLKADIVFTDGPWTQGNMRSFYTKASKAPKHDFNDFILALFKRIEEIRPKVCYLEIGKNYLADYIVALRKLYPYVSFYNATYYHNKSNLCYVVRGSDKAKKPALDGMDEETIINWVAAHEDYDCIGDLCMGRGLVGLAAASNSKRFVGTELNHKRLACLVESLCKMGYKYKIQEGEQL